MTIDFSQFTKSLSIALDYAEKALFDVTPLHGLRVAAMTARMAEHVGYDKETVYSLAQAALLHDCALSEYLSDETPGSEQPVHESKMASHCVAGENMLKKLPFYGRVQGAVLYHHERADGKGALGMASGETPLYAQLIHLADAADVAFALHSVDDEKYRRLRLWVSENLGTAFTSECTEAFLQCISLETLQSMAGETARALFDGIMPCRMIDVSVGALREMSSVFAEITDYKSHFTWRHSMGIAEKAEIMGKYYSLPDEECEKLFIAGALHDIGKLLTSNAILEKPGRLTPEEYREIQNHAVGTWELLRGISGMEDITLWAALHHEKLDGSGYPFGYTGARLDRNSRLMACLDIYQALVEDRPYKSGMRHGDAMTILRKMGASGQLDSSLIDDIDSCFSRSHEPAVRQEKPDKAEHDETQSAARGEAYRCPVCGYVLEGELPDDFICPRCEQPGSIFEKV